VCACVRTFYVKFCTRIDFDFLKKFTARTDGEDSIRGLLGYDAV